MAALRTAKYKAQTKRYYNRKVKHKALKVGDFVLRKNEASRKEGQKKLDPNWEGPYQVISAKQTGTNTREKEQVEDIVNKTNDVLNDTFIGPESPPELRRRWYVEGHIRFGVISFILAHRYQRTIRRRSLARSFSDRFSLESSGTFDTHRQTRSASKSQRTPSKNKEPSHLRRLRRLEDRSRTREKVGRSKSRGKRSGHQETNSDSEYEKGLEDTYEDLNSPYKRPKATLFTQRITRFKYHRRAKLPRNIRVYERNKDPEDHLSIFSAAAEQEEWPMPVWCKMFRQTLGGAARNWFDDLDPRSVDNFEELSQKFLDEFSQQKRYAKDPTEIHGIKRRQKEGLQAFMDRFKSESSHIKGVPPVLRISAFMHGHGHPELTKKLNDKIPKTVDEMFERVRAFIRGEVVAGSAEMVFPP
ncbi:reverse transcriptase domain-containing protein [Tanacetum coccineum]